MQDVLDKMEEASSLDESLKAEAGERLRTSTRRY